MNKIPDQLTQIEKTHQIEILFACEAGSRAWGFASPESDYDVRFLYKKNLDFYLSLQQEADQINLPIEGDYDTGGWDIRKALLLLRKSNVPLLEWLHGPVIYLQKDKFIDVLKPLSLTFFSPIAGFHHYQSMAEKHSVLVSENNIKLKHLFYALRAALAANWIIQYQTFPPVNFDELADGIKTIRKYRQEIEDLKALKAEKSESYIHSKSERIDRLLKDILKENLQNTDQLKPSYGNVKILDKFFIDLVKS